MENENENYKVVYFDLPVGRMWYVVDKRNNLAVKISLSEEDAWRDFEERSRSLSAA